MLIAKPLDVIAKKNNWTTEEMQAHLTKAKQALFAERNNRIRPGLDDKVLTAWNALMLSGYIDAYRATNNTNYLNVALRNADFLRTTMLQKDGRLLRNYKDGKTAINGFLDDYALTIQAFTDLYQVTFDEQWMQQAAKLTEYTIQHFYDAESGMFNYTSDLDPPLIARKMEIGDNVIPGSNSIMANNLRTLGQLLYNTDYTKKAQQMLANMRETVSTHQQPGFFSNWCNVYLNTVRSPYEIAIMGEDCHNKRADMMQHYLPHALFLGGNTEGSMELLKDKLMSGETLIYVCKDKVCKFPVEEVKKALEMMK